MGGGHDWWLSARRGCRLPSWRAPRPSRRQWRRPAAAAQGQRWSMLQTRPPDGQPAGRPASARPGAGVHPALSSLLLPRRSLRPAASRTASRGCTRWPRLGYGHSRVGTGMSQPLWRRGSGGRRSSPPSGRPRLLGAAGSAAAQATPVFVCISLWARSHDCGAARLAVAGVRTRAARTRRSSTARALPSNIHPATGGARSTRPTSQGEHHSLVGAAAPPLPPARHRGTPPQDAGRAAYPVLLRQTSRHERRTADAGHGGGKKKEA